MNNPELRLVRNCDIRDRVVAEVNEHGVTQGGRGDGQLIHDSTGHTTSKLFSALAANCNLERRPEVSKGKRCCNLESSTRRESATKGKR